MQTIKTIRNLLLSSLLMASLPVWADGGVSRKLSGTPIGSPSVDYGTGNISTTVNQPSDAFDGNINTYYASYGRSRTWVGLDLGQPCVITRVGWCPRNHDVGPGRVQLALFEGSNSPDFLDAVPLYLIPTSGTLGRMEYADVNVSRGFRYVRYVGPNEARCNIGELEFYGYEGEGDDSRFYQVTNLPTVSIHTYSGNDPVDKVNELESNLTITYDGGMRIQEYPILTRCRGNASIGFPKKPYRIKFNDGKSHHMLKGSPLESPAKAKKWTLINNYGDKTLMRNILAFEFSRRLGMPYTVYCQAVDVIMNGEYKGCYQLCDQITVDPNRVPITEMEPYETEGDELTGGYMVEVDAHASEEPSWFNSTRGNPVTIKSPDEDDIVTAQKNYIRNYFNQMESALFGTNYKDPSKGYRQFIDVESFDRHFIVGEFSGNTDTYWSTYMYKERGESTFTIGPCWDFDLAFNNDSRTYPVNNRSDWVYRSGGSAAGNMRSFVDRLISDEYALNRMKSIWRDMRNSGAFSDESLVAYVDSMEEELRASANLNFIRWPILNSRVHLNAFALGSFEAEVNVVRTYIPERIAWIDNKLGYREAEMLPDSTFYISTPEELIEFANYVRKGASGSNGYLMADIDMQGYSDKFVPIGTGNYPYCGTFDGQNHRIKNLHITGVNNVGLFGTVTGNTVVQNLIFDSSCSVSGVSYVGVIGASSGNGDVIMRCIGNEASITATGVNAGGIIGCNYSSSATFTLENCYNTGTIVGDRESGALSGWVGGNATVTDCYNIGTVSGYENVNMYLYRGSANLSNTYSIAGSQGNLVSMNAVKSGELCYLLNKGNTDDPVWRQTLSMDMYPTFLPHAVVAKDGDTYYNSGINYEDGDINGDGTIDSYDLAALANYLIGRPNEIFILDNADVNRDESVDLYDLVGIANIIKNQNAVKSKVMIRRKEQGAASTSFTLPDFDVQASMSAAATVSAAFAEGSTAFYAEITPGEELFVDANSFVLGDLKGSSHLIDAYEKNGVVRVVAYSPANEDFDALAGPLFSFQTSATQNFTGSTLSVKNIRVATAEEKRYEPSDILCNVGLESTPVRYIEIAQNLYIAEKGGKVELSATVYPATATVQDLTWICSDTRVGYVTNGVFTALGSGVATLTARAKDGSGAEAVVRVRVVGGTFEIASPVDLQEFSEVINKGYKVDEAVVTADLDMAGVAFEPIGTGENLYSGTFDGQGHVISNLVIEKPNDTGVGLFGHIMSPATIRNLVLDASCWIAGKEKVGLIGQSDRQGIIYLEKLGNEGQVRADVAPAGIIGNANNSSVAYITDCYSTGLITTIIADKTDADAGQISGWLGNVGAVVTNCWSTSDITGFQTSGFAPSTDRTFARVGGSKNTFINCYSQVSKQVNLTDIEKFRSGEVTYLLNTGNTDNPVWHQLLGTDLHPMLSGTSVVYKIDENQYANTPDGIDAVPFDIENADIYTLTGIKVSKPQRGGIYIINGVRVLIR